MLGLPWRGLFTEIKKVPFTNLSALFRLLVFSIGAIIVVHTDFLCRQSYAVPFQAVEVYKRTIIMYRREPVLTKARLGQTVVVAVLVGLIFLQLGDSQVPLFCMCTRVLFVTLLVLFVICF